MKFLRQMAQESVFEQIKHQIPNIEARPGEPGSWNFQLTNGKLHQGRARLENQWLTLDVDLPGHEMERRGADPLECWQTLLKQGLPCFPAKFVPNWGNGEGTLRLETLLPQEQNRSAPIVEAFSDLTGCLETARPENGSCESNAFNDEQQAILKTSLAEIHRPCTIDDQARISTDLISEREKSFRQRYRHTANISPSGKEGIRVRVPILEGLSLDPDQRQAIGGILLEAGGRLRLVRGIAFQENGLASVALEVTHRWPVSPERLDLLLSVLSIACQQVAPEIEEFSRGDAAARYQRSFGIARQVDPDQPKEVLNTARQNG